MVRDKIPEIVRRDGKIPKTHRLSAKDYKYALKEKLVEEAQEVRGAGKRDELVRGLGDVEEVLLALMDTYKISCSEVTKARNKRKKERGTFLQRIFLESVR